MAKGEIFTGLPKWAQGLIAVAIIGGLGFIGYKIYKGVGKIKEDKDSKAVADDADKALKDELAKGNKLSFPAVNYSSAINTIVKLLNGCETFGSELQVVYEVMKVVKTPADWYYLVKTFGKKDIDDCGWGKTNYDLTTLLKDQLDTAGAYAIDPAINGYKKSGWAINTIDILEDYLKTKGVTI